jgi:ATP-binding cassette subfamily B protein
VVAIVGPNGAGKTTLTKLLCRFYDPDAGSVELDGVDLREFSLSELRNMITVLFQFPMPYQLSAAQNIALGDINREPTTAALEAAARSAGAHDRIARLPQGYTNQLGRWFSDGAELSGGEWQRIATARAFFRQAPIILLDEPTSAMDSWAEADWFERLRNLASGRTSLIITHRFTIAMRADVIHVMDQGRIVESGSHQELLALDGLYAQSWSNQIHASDTSAMHADVPIANQQRILHG